MTSLLSWLDYNDEDRRKMREVISLFREQGTLDELGIGVVRDTIANLLFPGTTTIQTRARYFLFLPWIYSEIERRHTSGARAQTEAKKLEIKLVYALEHGGHHGGEGVIGWEARERLKRFPSVIYWGGLGTYDIRRFTGSIDTYFSSLASFNHRREAHRSGDGDEIHERLRHNWDRTLPPPPDGWLDETTFTLRWTDAEFLSERIVTAVPDSLLTDFLRRDTDLSDVALPWDVPTAKALDPELQRRLDHARRFSQVVHSAPLVYNLMLAEQAISFGMSGKYAEWKARHMRALEAWAEATIIPGQGAADWDINDFWNLIVDHNPHLPEPTRRFIDTWIKVAAEKPEAIADAAPDIRHIIETRERQVKGSQARLVSRRSLERWKGDAGTRQLDFRWPVARQLITDVREGLSDAAT